MEDIYFGKTTKIHPWFFRIDSSMKTFHLGHCLAVNKLSQLWDNSSRGSRVLLLRVRESICLVIFRFLIFVDNYN